MLRKDETKSEKEDDGVRASAEQTSNRTSISTQKGVRSQKVRKPIKRCRLNTHTHTHTHSPKLVPLNSSISMRTAIKATKTIRTTKEDKLMKKREHLRKNPGIKLLHFDNLSFRRSLRKIAGCLFPLPLDTK